MSDGARARKLADRVHEVVAEALEKRIKDPRLGFVTVTDARVTDDLQHATVFYTVFGSPEEQQASAAALESAKGVLRSEVGRRTGIRLTPTLEFVPTPCRRTPRTSRTCCGRPASATPRSPGSPPARSTRATPTRTRSPCEDGRGRDGRRARGRHPGRGRSLARPARTVTGGATASGLVVVDKPAGLTSHDVVRGCAGWPAPARSGTPGRWTRWRPASWCSASSGPPGC